MLKTLMRVKKNKGALGIDILIVENTKPYLQQNWLSIHEKLLEEKYKHKPILEVEIPKPNGVKRLLRIPIIIDRLVQQALCKSGGYL